MSRTKYVARILKYIALFIFYIIKLVVTLLPRIFREVLKAINKQLRFSITFKTTAAYTLLFTGILIILGIIITGSFSIFLFDETNKSLQKDSQIISSFISESSDIPRDKIKTYADIKAITVTLIDKDEHVIYTTGNNPLTATEPRNGYSPQTPGSNYLHYQLQLTNNYGVDKIQVYRYVFREKTYVGGLAGTLAISFFLVTILTIVIGSRTSRKMLRPIDNMTRTARSMSVGDLNTRLAVVDSHDELKELAETFNEMLDRIQTSFEQQNVFVSDASHELRTPISVIQGYAGLLQRWGKEEKEVLDESVNAIKSEADYMKDLVDRLLFLASADKKNLQLELYPWAVNELIDEVLKETRLIDSGHQICGDINEAAIINGDRGLIKQALRIFIDNSMKYTPIGGSIALNSQLQGKAVLISVGDNGFGISPEDLPYIFNRFYKCDKSRTRETGGAGLGLSIAKWIIEQHRGEIKVDSAKDQGTKFSIYLPLA